MQGARGHLEEAAAGCCTADGRLQGDRCPPLGAKCRALPAGDPVRLQAHSASICSALTL